MRQRLGIKLLKTYGMKNIISESLCNETDICISMDVKEMFLTGAPTLFLGVRMVKSDQSIMSDILWSTMKIYKVIVQTLAMENKLCSVVSDGYL